MLERKVNVLTKKDDHWKKRSYLCFHVLGVEAGTGLVHSSGTRIINSPHQSLSLQEITHSNIIINYIFICTTALITLNNFYFVTCHKTFLSENQSFTLIAPVTDLFIIHIRIQIENLFHHDSHILDLSEITNPITVSNFVESAQNDIRYILQCFSSLKYFFTLV